jgi:hypothetical protein
MLTLSPGQNAQFLTPYYFTQVNGVQHYILDKNLIHYQYEPDIDLFVNPYNAAILYKDENTLLGFVIDPAWNKLVYGDYLENQWIKIHGRWGTDTNGWYHPRSVTYDGEDNLYIADTENGRIVGLIYEASNESINPDFTITMSADILQRPWDLDVDDRGNYDNMDDLLWVVDKGLNAIVPIIPWGWNYGSVWGDGPFNSLVNHATGTIYSDLSGLNGIAVRKDGTGVNTTVSERIYVTDWKLRKLFLIEATNNCSNCHAGASDQGYIYKEKTFASDVLLSGVESDYFGDVWVVDNANGKLYKYTWDLQYLDELSGLNYPTSVASVRRHHQNMAVTEQWTNTTGIRTYSHGANIRNLSVATSYHSANFAFRLTNYGYLTAKVFQNNTLIATLKNHAIYPSGNTTLNWYHSSPEGLYSQIVGLCLRFR